MRIHSNVITESDVRAIVAKIGQPIGVQHVSTYGSRSRHHAIEMVLNGSSKFGGQYGALDYSAATWDEWGIVLAALFDADPDALVPRVYESAEHFHWATGDRYRTLTIADKHARHNWLSGDASGRSVTGSYFVQSCKCGAIIRRMAHGRSFSTEIVREFDGVV